MKGYIKTIASVISLLAVLVVITVFSEVRGETANLPVLHKTNFLAIPDGKGEWYFTVLFAGQSASTRATILSEMKERGYNYLYFSPINEGDFEGYNSFKKFNYYEQNPNNFKAILQEVVNAGLKPVVWLALDDAPNFHRDSAEKLPGIWTNFIPAIDSLVDSYVLGLEMNEYWSRSEQENLGEYLNNLTDKPIFVHFGRTESASINASWYGFNWRWMDGMIYQYGARIIEDLGFTGAQNLVRNRTRELVPIFNSKGKIFIAGEYAFEVPESQAVTLGDIAMAEGAHGFGNGGTASRYSTVNRPYYPGDTTSRPPTNSEVIYPGANWLESTPEAQGMSSAKLGEVSSNIIGDAIVIKNGYQVWKWGSVSNPHGGWASVVRSMLTTAWGIAIKNGDIPGGIGVLERLVSSLPGSSYGVDGAVKHLLSYTSCGDPPGSYWQYSCNWDEMYQVFKEVTGKTAYEYNNRYLYPILGGGAGFEENVEPPYEDIEFETSRLKASVSQAARWGYLWLNNGKWNGQQLVDPAFVARTIQPGPDGNGTPRSNGTSGLQDEGWQIHLSRTDNAEFNVPGCPRDLFMAAGGGMHYFIIVSPSLNLVVARWNPDGDPENLADYNKYHPKTWMGQICQAVTNTVIPPSTGGELPRADHAIKFGYYKVDAQYGDFKNEVKGYTNTQLIEQESFLRSDLKNFNGLKDALRETKALGDDIVFFPSDDYANGWSEGLDTVAEFWSDIDWIYLADEPNMSKEEAERYITDFKNLVSRRRLSSKPIAINFKKEQILNGSGYKANNLDIVGTEAYLDPSVQNDPNIVSVLNNQIDQLKNKIGNRPMFLVIQAYDRNGAWTNLDNLIKIQTPPYLKAYNDRNVVGLFMFSYARTGGTRDHPELANCHKAIWNAISGESVQTGTCGDSGPVTPIFEPDIVATKNLGGGTFPDVAWFNGRLYLAVQQGKKLNLYNFASDLTDQRLTELPFGGGQAFPRLGVWDSILWIAYRDGDPGANKLWRSDTSTVEELGGGYGNDPVAIGGGYVAWQQGGKVQRRPLDGGSPVAVRDWLPTGISRVFSTGAVRMIDEDRNLVPPYTRPWWAGRLTVAEGQDTGIVGFFNNNKNALFTLWQDKAVFTPHSAFNGGNLYAVTAWTPVYLTVIRYGSPTIIPPDLPPTDGGGYGGTDVPPQSACFPVRKTFTMPGCAYWYELEGITFPQIPELEDISVIP